jgi:hypothetical protein
MTKEQLYAHPGWESCTFEGAEMSTLLLGLQSTFREKLEWLEEAETLALKLRAGRRQRQAALSPSRPVR